MKPHLNFLWRELIYTNLRKTLNGENLTMILLTLNLSTGKFNGDFTVPSLIAEMIMQTYKIYK
jgi:hypothetical protein